MNKYTLKKYLQLPVVLAHVRALEEEFWYADGGRSKIEDGDAEYLLLMLQFRWASIERWCLPSMEDCTLKEMLSYYFILNNIFDEYDVIPEYDLARSKWKQLKNQYPCVSFVGKHNVRTSSSDNLSIEKEIIKSYPSYINQQIIDVTMEEKPRSYRI